MKFNRKILLISTTYLLLNASTYAQGYSSSQTNGYTSSASNSNSYSSSQNNSYQSSQGNVQTYHSRMQPRTNEHFSFSVNGPDFHAGFSNGTKFHFDSRLKHRQRQFGPLWVDSFTGAPLPPDAVMGGAENGVVYYICRTTFGGGLQPGKMINGKCHISYMGNEVMANQFQILVSHQPMSWIASRFGYLPNNAYPGGHEQGNTLYICQAQYHHGIHPGKIIDRNCHIAWGGREISVPYYNVLVGQ